MDSTNMTNDSVSMQNSTCNDAKFRGGILHASLPFAIFIIVVLSYLSKQESKRQRQLEGNLDQSGNLVQRFFSLIFPIDLFDNHDRLPYCLAIGGASGIILDLISGKIASYFLGVTIPKWATILVGTLATIEISIDFFPMFGCISSKSQIAAKGIGFMYVTAWFVLLTMFLKTCSSEEYFVLQRLPVVLCIGLLSLYFLGKFIMGLFQRYKGTTPTNKERLHKTHQAVHVRNLLNKRKEIEYSGWRGLIFKIYKPRPGFTYPNRVILPMFVSLIGLWNLAVIIIPLGLKLKTDIINLLMGLAQKNFQGDTDGFHNATEKLNQIDSGLTASWKIASPLALLVTVMHIFGILVKYRFNLLSLRSGKYKLPQSVTLTSVDKVVGSLKYIGFQVSVLVIGYLATQLLLFLLLLVPTAGVLLSIWDFDAYFVDVFLKFFVPAAIVGITLMTTQTIVTKLVFVQDKLKPTDKDKPLAVKHRTFFLIFSYVTMFLNMLFGLFFAFLRVLIALIGIISYLSRMDQPIWVSGGGDKDIVQILYVGNVLTENAHSNPIMVMFCHFMVFDILKPRQKQLRALQNHSKADLVINEEIKQGDVESPKRKKEPLHLLRYFRWHLAYTLIKNPSLIELRKHSAIVHDPDAVLKNHDSMLGKSAEGHNVNIKLLPHLVQVLKRQENHLKMKDSDTLPTKEDPSLNSVDPNLIALESLTSTEFAVGDQVSQSKAPLPPSNVPPSQDTTQPAVQPQPPSNKYDPTFFGPGSESNA